MDAQQVFDRVATHLLAQKKRALAKRNGRGVCMYRAPDGCKCAAGCLIADSRYTPRMEGMSADLVAAHFKLPQFFHEYLTLICELQAVHDGNVPSRWLAALRRVAKFHNLNTDALQRV